MEAYLGTARAAHRPSAGTPACSTTPSTRAARRGCWLAPAHTDGRDDRAAPAPPSPTCAVPGEPAAAGRGRTSSARTVFETGARRRPSRRPATSCRCTPGATRTTVLPAGATAAFLVRTRPRAGIPACRRATSSSSPTCPAGRGRRDGRPGPPLRGAARPGPGVHADALRPELTVLEIALARRGRAPGAAAGERAGAGRPAVVAGGRARQRRARRPRRHRRRGAARSRRSRRPDAPTGPGCRGPGWRSPSPRRAPRSGGRARRRLARPDAAHGPRRSSCSTTASGRGTPRPGPHRQRPAGRPRRRRAGVGGGSPGCGSGTA